MLIYTGYKMCEPLVWRHMAHIGREQLGIFTITVIATLCTDLLWGIGIGVLAKFMLNMVLYRYALAANDPAGRAPPFLHSALTFFRTPVVRHEMRDDEWHVFLARPLVCFNSMKLVSELDSAPDAAKVIVVHVGSEVGLVDHTACENLMYVVEELSRNERPVRVVGLDAMKPLSQYENGTHIAATSLAPI